MRFGGVAGESAAEVGGFAVGLIEAASNDEIREVQFDAIETDLPIFLPFGVRRLRWI
jgi:hypothetical protein